MVQQACYTCGKFYERCRCTARNSDAEARDRPMTPHAPFHFAGNLARLAPCLAFLIGFAAPLPAEANALLAQRIVEGLPPPPDTPYLDQGLPPPLIQPTAPNVTAPAITAPTVTAPIAPAAAPIAPAAAPSPEQYLVYVNGDSSRLLDQVRRVESGALVQTFGGQQVIQVGLFEGESIAQRRVDLLAAQGIGAQIARVGEGDLAPATLVTARADLPAPDLLPLVSVDRQVEFGQPPDFSQFSADDRVAQAPSRASSYYVVIPGRARDLPNIADLAILLGGGLNVPERSIQERTAPLGPHVLIGPFVSQSAADRWNRYFRDFIDRDSRVYYRR